MSAEPDHDPDARWGEWTVGVGRCDGQVGVYMQHTAMGPEGLDTFETGMPPDVAEQLGQSLIAKAQEARQL